MKIYVPEDSTYNNCYVVQGEGVIRAYKEKPQNGRDIDYRDYYINSSYIYRDGNQTFSNYATLPVCLSSDVITNEVYHRNDFDSILIIVLIMSIFCFYIPLKIFLRLFRRLQ